MRPTLKHLWQGTRWCTSYVLSFALWSLWLILSLLLAFQAYIATHNELEVPPFLLRSLEERLAASGVRVTFGRTLFDPAGRVLIEKAQIFLPGFGEPVVTARAIYTRLDPWALAVGQFNPGEIRVTGAALAVPAMLSPTGRAEEILRDLDTTFTPRDGQLDLAQLSARIAGVTVVARGAIRLPPRDAARAEALPIADFLAHNFSALARQLVAASEQLAALGEPSLALELAPSETRAALATVTLHARSLKLEVPQPIAVSRLRVVTRVPLLGEAPVVARLEATADSLTLPFGASARSVRALVRGTLRPAKLQFDPRELDLSVASLTAAGFTADAVSARIQPGPLPRVTAEIGALLMGAPLALRVDADLRAQHARVHFAGALSTQVLTPLSDLLRVDVRKYFNFATLPRLQGDVRLGAGWKFANLTARAELTGIDAYHVIMEEGRAAFTFDGRHFSASEAWARIGDNFARGTFEQDLKTLEYRFLLEGRLRPLAIGGWFGPWWPNFFNQLQFPVAAPDASVEVSGRWTEGRRSFIYVFADSKAPVIRGAALDRVRTRLVIRPAFYDGLEVFATHPTGEATGTFRYTTDPVTFDWRTLDLTVDSTLEPAVATKMMGPFGAAILAPFKWATAPALRLSGRLDGPAAPNGPHQTLRIEGHANGEFRFHDFPLENLMFTADLHDDDLTIAPMEASFAGGKLTGQAKVWGAGRDRRIGFDFALKDVSLGLAVTTLQDHTARRKGEPPTPPNKFLRERANVRLDLAASAEGRYDDPFSYHGTGNAVLQGSELGEVQMLGLLSELFKFTALRFTSARANFKIDGAKLTFPAIALRGANSAIDAHGDFALDRRELDFKAKIFPFQESTGILKSVVGAVLTPLSNIFEVKLTGTLDKPEWAFVVGPTNFLRSLTGDSTPATAPPDSPAPVAPPAPTSGSRAP